MLCAVCCVLCAVCCVLCACVAMRCVCPVYIFAQWLLDNVMCNMDSGDVEPGCVAVVVPRRAIAEGLSKFVSNMRGCTVM
jgi:hypothetical protein